MVNQSNKELLPYFSIDGILPPGDYHLTIENLSLFPPLINTQQLWEVGVDGIYIDGSFVEEKDHPNGIDGYFIVNLKDFISGKIQKELNKIDQYQAWNWNNRQFDNKTKKRQLIMWHKYRVELYPYFGQSSGILDEFGNKLDCPAASRKTRTNR